MLSDHLGTPRKVLDGATGVTRWAWDAKEPFGHELPNSNPSGLGAFELNLRFPGQVLDVETGLFHNGHRDYHSKLGRYLQSDPLGLEAGWNTYAYVGGNPVSGVDPLGLVVEYGYDKGSMGPKGADYMRQQVQILKNGSPTVRGMMKTLEGSPRSYFFLVGSVGENNFGPNPKLNGRPQISWNMRSYAKIPGGICYDSRDFNPLAGLAHEIGHAYLYEMRQQKGTFSFSDQEIYYGNKIAPVLFQNPIIYEEFNNLHLERTIHMEMGWPEGRSLIEYYNPLTRGYSKN